MIKLQRILRPLLLLVNVVMLSEAEFNNLLENLYVRSNPEYYNELLKSIEQLKKGKGKKRELQDE